MIKGYFKCIAILICFLFTFKIGSSQFSAPILKFETINKDQGLQHSFILSIYQDRNGVMWFGTWGGLNRYDGATMTSYNSIINKDFTNSVVTAICEQKITQNSLLWLGTKGGLILFDRAKNTFQKIAQPDIGAVKAIVEDEKGLLWLGTEKGLFALNPISMKIKSAKLFSAKQEISTIECITFEKPGVLWLGTSTAGLFKYNCTTQNCSRYVQSKNFAISAILHDGGNLLLSTRGDGIICFNKKTSTFSSLVFTKPIQKDASGIVKDIKGNIWFSTLGGGLYKGTKNANNSYNIENFTNSFNNTHSICSNFLALIYKDQNNNIWIGSSGSGISKINDLKQKFKQHIIERNTGKNDNNIQAICDDHHGNVWFGLQNEGLYIYNKKDRTHTNILFNKQNKFDPKNSVKCIYQDGQMRVWVGTDAGLYLFSNATAQPKYYHPFINNKHLTGKYGISSICVTRNNTLWISAMKLGLFKIDLNRPNSENTPFKFYEHSTDSSSIQSNVIYSIYEDSDALLWFATSKGLCKYSPTNDNFTAINNITSSCIYEARRNKGDYLWIGTFGNGIQLLNKRSLALRAFTVADGLCSNNINGILESKEGVLWLSTGKGIAAISTTNLYDHNSEKKFNASKEGKVRIRNYSMSDGLQAHEFNLNCAAISSDVEYIFGGPRGFNVFNPKQIDTDKSVYPTLISDFKIFNLSIKNDSNYKENQPEYLTQIDLNYTQNYFSIYFSEACHTSPEKISYNYQLEGFDKDWITTDALHNSASYTNLPYGTYFFKLKGFNADGFTNGKITTIKITVNPPFWRTLGFEIFAVLLLLLLAFLIFRLVFKKLAEKKNAALNAQIEKIEKEKLESELTFKMRELASIKMNIEKKAEKLNDLKSLLSDIESNDEHKLKRALNLIENELKNGDSVENFEHNFNLLHNDFIKRITQAYPNLSHTDIKICAYMRMNLSSKEIADLLNITTKSLETSRMRIRKKMQLDSSVFLLHYILSF